MNAQIATSPKPKARRGANSGNRNQGSNWISKKRRAQIYARDGHKCIWCLRATTGMPGHFRRPTLDHVVSRSRGGTNHTHNLVTSCGKCNTARGERSLYEYASSLPGDPIRMILRVLGTLDKPLKEVT